MRAGTGVRATGVRGLCTAVVAGVGTAAISRILGSAPPGGADLWTRTNHAGRTVTLLEGPSLVLGAAAGALAGGSPAGALAALGAGALGALDDLAGDPTSKGLSGHLSALAHGRVTTGAVKVVGLAATGVAAAALAGTEAPRRGDGRPVPARPVVRPGWRSTVRPAVRPEVEPAGVLRGVLDVVVGGAVVAGSANLVNLLDLRPGRALKAILLLSGPLALWGCRAAPAAAGAAVAALTGDLGGVSMLGDTGANAAGALIGVALIERLGRRGRLVVLAVLTSLTLVSEKVSFTAVIESTPGLREVDAWGRATRAAPEVPA